MNPSASLDVLIAQIQIQLEQLQSLVVASPLRPGIAERVAERVVAGLRGRGIGAILYLPAGDAPSDAAAHSNHSGSGVREDSDASFRTFTSAQAGTPQLAKSLLTSPGGLTVAAAPGILEDPSALFLAAASDAVLMVAEAGRTAREDLKRARLELETAGAHLVGAVLAE